MPVVGQTWAPVLFELGRVQWVQRMTSVASGGQSRFPFAMKCSRRRLGGRGGPGAAAAISSRLWMACNGTAPCIPLSHPSVRRAVRLAVVGARPDSVRSEAFVLARSGRLRRCYPPPMRPVEALYENGMLRPAKPLNVRQGERVAVIVVRQRTRESR